MSLFLLFLGDLLVYKAAQLAQGVTELSVSQIGESTQRLIPCRVAETAENYLLGYLLVNFL